MAEPTAAAMKAAKAFWERWPGFHPENIEDLARIIDDEAGVGEMRKVLKRGKRILRYLRGTYLNPGTNDDAYAKGVIDEIDAVLGEEL